MAQQIINIGTIGGDGTGDTIYDGGAKINANFTELYAGNILTGDKSSALDAGTFKQMSLGDDYLYVCTQTGTAGNAIWKKTPLFKST